MHTNALTALLLSIGAQSVLAAPTAQGSDLNSVNSFSSSSPQSLDSSLTTSPTTTKNANGAVRQSGAKPFYVIAHRVLTTQGVRDAISHGANAVEIDMTAWKKGWWADHDGLPTSAGDTARDMFLAIAEQRRAGKTITLVWLDIKNPDWCKPNDAKWRHCSVAALQDLSREILEPVGVRTMYGFYNAKGEGWPYIRDSLNNNEAINLNGETKKEVLPAFQNGGPAEISKRVYSYGYFNMPFQFGNCQEDNYYTCTELRQATESRQFGQVFGWTTGAGEAKYVDKLLDIAGIDGLIYGHKLSYYRDTSDTRQAANELISWVKAHPDRRFIAKQEDKPW